MHHHLLVARIAQERHIDGVQQLLEVSAARRHHDVTEEVIDILEVIFMRQNEQVVLVLEVMIDQPARHAGLFRNRRNC